jgi:hypothetical protein
VRLPLTLSVKSSSEFYTGGHLMTALSADA